MIASSNGGAMPEFGFHPVEGNYRKRAAPRASFMEDYPANSPLAKNAKKLVARNFNLEFPKCATSHFDLAELVKKCMHSVAECESAEAVAVTVASLIADLSEEGGFYNFRDYGDPTRVSWRQGLDCILMTSPSFVANSIHHNGLGNGCYGLATTQSCMSAWLTREACAWFIDECGFPAVSSSSQALMYLISANNCHSQIGKAWFIKRPDRVRSQSEWFHRYPQLAFFYGAQAAISGTEVFAPAFAN